MGTSVVPLQSYGQKLCTPTKLWAQALCPYKVMGTSVVPLQSYGQKLCTPTKLWAETLHPYKVMGTSIVPLQMINLFLTDCLFNFLIQGSW